jgi:hypothetical protein
VGPERRTVSPSLVVSIVALVLAVAGGAYAAGTINGKNLKNRSVPGKKLKKNTLTGKQVRESKLGKVPSAKRADSAATATNATSALNATTAGSATTATDAAKVGGKAPSAFLGASVERVESPVADGTGVSGAQQIDQACPAGTTLLSGGPANVSSASVVLESTPAPDSTNTWRVRIVPGASDPFSVVVLCAHQ